MKKLLLAISGIVAATSLSFCVQAQPRGIGGDWNGQIAFPGQKLAIVFHISKTESGYTATVDSPDQGGEGMPATSTTFADSLLTITATNLRMTYTGRPEGDSLIRGTFEQGGYRTPLILRRGAFERNRPQEPKPPYPYASEEVRFDNPKAEGVTLAGTFTVPEAMFYDFPNPKAMRRWKRQHGNGRFPAVVLVTGSGAQNRNEEIAGHKPFLVLADYLTCRGIAVLRYDDRGYARSTGQFAGATTADFASDALSAVEYLKTRPEIDPRRIGVIGHSEGGTISFICAAEAPQDVAFIVSMAGMAVRGDSLLTMQTAEILRKSGKMPAGALDIYMSARRKITQAAVENTPEYIVENADRIIAEALPADTPFDLRIGLYLEFRKLIEGFATPWLNYFLKFDPGPVICRVECPVLAINGSTDLQVEAHTNIEAIRSSLGNRSKGQSVLRIYPGLNHLFQPSDTGLPDEYVEIEQTIAPVVLSDIADWILKVAK